MSVLQVYAGDTLAYDSRLREYALTGLVAMDALNKGGTAEITMPPGHPAYRSFPAFSTPVTIYRDEKLRWRGRALYPTDDFYNRRTITCEGERCFFRDAVMRPYLFQTDPASIFGALLAVYNDVVEPWKQFRLGAVTVTDPNDYVRLESQNPGTVGDAMDKLVERCGGYILFSGPADSRVANWLKDLPYTCNQPIAFGENLLDFSRTGNTEGLATRIIPFGSVLQDGSGKRLQINVDGKDYVQDDEAVALRGVIECPMVWNDVTDSGNLLRKSVEALSKAKLSRTSIIVTALDLSKQNKSLDSYQVGQMVPVYSEPHDALDTFALTAMRENLLDPTDGQLSLGKETASLTGADVAGNKNMSSVMENVREEIKKDYQLNISNAVSEVSKALSSEISQTAENLHLEVASEIEESRENLITTLETYRSSLEIAQEQIRTAVEAAEAVTTEQGLTISRMQSLVEQTAQALETTFTQVTQRQNLTDGALASYKEEIGTFIRNSINGIEIGDLSGAEMLHLAPGRLEFMVNGSVAAYLSNNRLYVEDITVNNDINMGGHWQVTRQNGYGIRWIGG